MCIISYPHGISSIYTAYTGLSYGAATFRKFANLMIASSDHPRCTSLYKMSSVSPPYVLRPGIASFPSRPCASTVTYRGASCVRSFCKTTRLHGIPVNHRFPYTFAFTVYILPVNHHFPYTFAFLCTPRVRQTDQALVQRGSAGICTCSSSCTR